MLIPYKFLVPLLIFTLLIGVVIGDRLAAEQRNGNGIGDGGDGRSGSCSGLASAGLHACVHRHGSWRAPEVRARTGGVAGWPNGGRDACGFEESRDGGDD